MLFNKMKVGDGDGGNRDDKTRNGEKKTHVKNFPLMGLVLSALFGKVQMQKNATLVKLLKCIQV